MCVSVVPAVWRRTGQRSEQQRSAVALVWAAFGAPAAPLAVGEPRRLLLSLAPAAVAAGALVGVGRPLAAAGFAVIAVGDTALVYWFGWA